jgi:plastocyanin
MNAARRIGFAVVAVITVAIAVFAIARGVSTDTGSSKSSAAAGSSGGGGQPVKIQSFNFVPGSITIKAGTKVTWTNDDPTQHSIKSQNGQFDSQDLSQGQTFTATFSTPGTYAYICGIHNFMTGTVVVQG